MHPQTNNEALIEKKKKLTLCLNCHILLSEKTEPLNARIKLRGNHIVERKRGKGNISRNG